MAKYFAGALVVTLFVVGCSPSDIEEQVPLQLGVPVPGELALQSEASASSPVVDLIWVVGTRDCLKCQSLEPVLRRIHYQRPEVALRVVHIGREKEVQIVRTYLRRERLDVPVKTLDPRQHAESASSDWPVPLLLMATGGRVVWYLPPESEPIPNVAPEEMLDSVAKI
jgi:hypothetical protein